ncbi:site-specific integrase [Ruegeria sp. HKCCD7318]|uniref:tyrosine-type recombinase/integrase n=1 Tax=Ruegeria sp. HKCCD7318 TaxID=2683014 RepID=UPI001492B441|nr:site-specific integrase [Ruegeria sp. HKCCD7318]NOE32174.1 tyrosine-type recombinase/integrase [Ruegeria sp. HKCCD7318]
MKKKLTSRYVATVTAPGPKRLEVYDQTLSGFGLRVSLAGRKTWFCSPRVDGRVRRLTIGTYPALSLADARQKAQEQLRNAQLGLEPEPKADTLGDVVPQFVELYAKPRNRGWRTQERLLMHHWKPLFDVPIDQIKRADAVRVLDSIVASASAGSANNAMAVFKKLMNWCVDRGMIDANPIAGLKTPRKPVARDRVLSDRELEAVWSAADKDAYPFGPLVQVLILTAQRRAEVGEMRWSEIDFETSTWTIPAGRAKNGIAHDVPLSPAVLDILQNVPRFAGSNFVFTTTGTTPVSGFGRLKERLDREVGFSDWWFHDLRRTAASGMARIGVAPHVIEKVLNHKTGVISGVAAVYNRYSYADEKREALEKWAMTVNSSAKNACERSHQYLTSKDSKGVLTPCAAN